MGRRCVRAPAQWVERRFPVSGQTAGAYRAYYISAGSRNRVKSRRSKLHILRFPASGKTHSFRCFFSPNQTRFAGLWFGGGSASRLGVRTGGAFAALPLQGFAPDDGDAAVSVVGHLLPLPPRFPRSDPVGGIPAASALQQREITPSRKP